MSDPEQTVELASTEARPNMYDEDGTSILELLIVLAKYKMFLLVVPLVTAILGAGISLTMTDVFRAKTSILPPQGQSSTSAMLAQQLGGLAGLVGGALKSPNDLYIGMLRSRTVADNLIQRFDLHKDQKYQSVTRAQLADRTTIMNGKDGIVTIEVDDADPKRAAELANAYVEELFKLTKGLALTEASQRRLFFERQFAEAKDNLASAEAAARQALESGGLVQVEGQGRGIVETTARLRGQISVKEVQIGAMRTFAADRNPELQLAQQELDAMKRELGRIEGASSGKSSKVPIGTGGGINSLNLLRNVKYYETIYELLARQYELAKIDEAKDSSVVQVMDMAVQPDLKFKPRRRQIVMLSALAGGFLAVLLAFAMHGLSVARTRPEHAERMARLKHHLSTIRGA